ncbi:MAG TPA: phosphotransferase, partial [Gemmataceae bacterium]
MTNGNMDLTSLIRELSSPAAYPYPAERVEVRQTHISVVFLAGPFVYKVKKPVDLGFLDFSTLARRRHFCEEEVRLNRRLAPEVYLGVVPVVRAPGGLRFEGEGEAVEWAVKMRYLPDAARFRERLLRGELTAADLERLAGRLAAFHASAASGAYIASFGTWEVVAANARENFTQSEAQAGDIVSASVFCRARDLTEEALARLRPVIEGRAARGVPRDTHGDLRLDHVYLLPDRPPPDDLVLVDCIEFNERFRYADPVADMAFLVMDLRAYGRRDLARAFADAYFRASGDGEGRGLMSFYTAYRSAVRAKVNGFKAAAAEVPAPERAAARERARAHWLLALGELESRARRPCLVLVGGLPGTG